MSSPHRLDPDYKSKPEKESGHSKSKALHKKMGKKETKAEYNKRHWTDLSKHENSLSGDKC